MLFLLCPFRPQVCLFLSREHASYLHGRAGSNYLAELDRARLEDGHGFTQDHYSQTSFPRRTLRVLSDLDDPAGHDLHTSTTARSSIGVSHPHVSKTNPVDFQIQFLENVQSLLDMHKDDGNSPA